MDKMGALSLVTKLPNNDNLVKPSVGQSKPFLIRVVAFLLMIQSRARSVFGMDEKVKKKLIFKLFICQVFNKFNARQLEKNILKGLIKNKLFLIILSFTIVCQLVMEFLKRFSNIERLD